MDNSTHPKFVVAKDVAEAVTILQEMGEKAIPIAGATWVMRGPLRDGNSDQAFVCLSRIEALRLIHVDDHQVAVGALATHQEIAESLSGHREFAALVVAAGQSANPTIRRAATIGGNICAIAFAASDLVPALLALDASVETQGLDDTQILPIATFLAGRATRPHTNLVTRILLPRSVRSSAHARVTLRKAGDYPVANISVAITLDVDGKINTAAVAIGSVEAVARRWTSFETAIVGKAPAPADMREIAAFQVNQFEGRDTPGAPGWYRLRVIPGLVSKAFKILQENQPRGDSNGHEPDDQR